MKKSILKEGIRYLFYVIFILGLSLSSCQGESVNEEKEEIPKEEEPEEEPPIAEGEFTIVALPDTQYYSAKPELGGKPEMFYSQIDWIKENQEEWNIVYVSHLGDITNDGDNPVTADEQWSVATRAMYGLESPKIIPYGVAVGNHDQYPWGWPISSTTEKYNQYFGVGHFEGRDFYGGNFGNDNDNHYDFFTAGDVDFIVVYIEYDRNLENPAAIQWADEILKQYSSHKAIVVSHFIIGNNGTKGTNTGKPGKFVDQGQVIYDELKDNPNLFMMLCGHVAGNGEGFREDTYNGNTIRTFLSDYQGRRNGGDGKMRIYTFSVEKNEIRVQTYSPYTKIYEIDGDSQFTTPLFD